MTEAAFPNGKRVAVLVSVLLENWSAGKWPSYFTRTTPLKAGVTDVAAIEWSHYGGREGIWRILKLLERCRVKATVFANALSAELYPGAVQAIVAAGHDIAAHGMSQDQPLNDLPPDAQQQSIRRALDTLERIAGRRPTGWASPVYSWTDQTTELLVREGLTWRADGLDASGPKLVRTPSGSIVTLPWCEFVDNRVLRASPRDFFDVYKDSFDYLYANEPMAILHLAVHSHFGGRPLIAAQLDRVLRYVAGYPDSWLPRHVELVDWFRATGQDDLSYARRFFGS